MALKEVTFSVDLTDEERTILRERTLREARAAARLDHPSVTHGLRRRRGGRQALARDGARPARSLQEILEEQGRCRRRGGADRSRRPRRARGRAPRGHRPPRREAGQRAGRHDGRACLTDFGIATITGDTAPDHPARSSAPPPTWPRSGRDGEEPRPPADLWSLGRDALRRGRGPAAVRPRRAHGHDDVAVVSEHPAPMVRAGPLEPVLRSLLTRTPPSGAPWKRSASPFLGSAPRARPPPRRCALAQGRGRARPAVQPRPAAAGRSRHTAHGARWRALADLLPNVSSGASASAGTVINLAAFGFPADPSIIGPFNIFDARVGAVAAARRSARAATTTARAALNERAEAAASRSARDLVVLVAVNLYLEAVTAASRIDVARAQQETAQALFQQAPRPQGLGARRRHRRAARPGADPEPAPALDRRARTTSRRPSCSWRAPSGCRRGRRSR